MKKERKPQKAEPRKPTEADILERMVELQRKIKQPPVPPKRRQPKIIRMQSRRMRWVQTSTRNPVRAIYQTPEQAARGTIVGEPKFTTREVGPGDKYNSRRDYECEGKETRSN